MADTAIHGRRNIIINGAMQVAQRGTSASSVTASQYLCDRWEYETIGEETVTISQTTDVPSGFSNSFKVEITTADSDVIASDYAVVKQVIEAQNLQHLKYGSSDAETITLSFYVKSSVTGTYSVGLEHGETASYYSQTYSISSANTWEKKTVTLTGNTATAINNDNGAGLHVNFALSAGTSYTTGSNGVWGTATNWFANHAVNVIGTANATFFITGVQLEVGEQATPFEHRSYGEELALCQRYYHRISRGSGASSPVSVGFHTGTQHRGLVHFTTAMRSSPTVDKSSLSDINVYHGGGIVTPTAISNEGVSDASITAVRFAANSTGASNGDATIIQLSADSFIDFDSEL